MQPQARRNLIDYLQTVDSPTLSNAIEDLNVRPRHEGLSFNSEPFGAALCANMTETSCMTAINEQGGKETQHGNDERFCSARGRCDGRS
jgi:hypothetical protein